MIEFSEVSRRSYRVARDQVEELWAEILPDAEESLKLAMTSYRSGEVGYLQVLTTQKTYVEANVANIEAWTELRKVATEIEGQLQTGGLNPAELGTALQNQPGGNQRHSILNQLQEGQSGQSLPAALQE